MLYMYEFEVFESGGCYIAVPFDMDGATEGENLPECYEMIADWLRTKAEDSIMHGTPLPKATFGNKACHGGEVAVFAIEVNSESIKKMSLQRAAQALGVSRGRVSQLISAGRLEAFRHDGKKWVTAASVNARLEEMGKLNGPETGSMPFGLAHEASGGRGRVSHEVRRRFNVLTGGMVPKESRCASAYRAHIGGRVTYCGNVLEG